MAHLCCGCVTFVACPSTRVVDRESGKTVEERVPAAARFQLGGLYGSLPGYLLVSLSPFQNYLRRRSEACGAKYDSPDSRERIAAFVEGYAVDTDEAELPVDDYRTLNEFFYRRLRPGARPVHDRGNAAAAVSPADCRLAAFEGVEDARRFLIKGRGFTLDRLLDTDDHPFAGGGVAVCRLAPNDYHRFHSPVSGTVREVRPVDGLYHSVKDVAVRSLVDVLGRNKRTVVTVDSPEFGRVALVIVGAIEVASINLTGAAEAGSELTKGDEVGFFAYGGSTVVVLFELGAARLDEDLVRNSVRGVETRVLCGESLAVAAGY